MARHAALRRQPARNAAFARRLISLHGTALPGAGRIAVTPVGHPALAKASKAASGPDRAATTKPRNRRRRPPKPRKEKTPVGEIVGVAPGEARPSPAAAPPAPSAPADPPEAGFATTAASADSPDCAQRCATLRSQGRFAEAARLARDGLAVAGDPGLLLVELSRAEFGLGRVNAAIDTARDAYFASLSRESVVHLIRLLTETRRFTREDGPALRRAVSRHPRQPLLLYAAGVFESMHGKPCDAEKWLRAALPLAPDEEARRAIAGELSRVDRAKAE